MGKGKGKCFSAIKFAFQSASCMKASKVHRDSQPLQTTDTDDTNGLENETYLKEKWRWRFVRKSQNSNDPKFYSNEEKPNQIPSCSVETYRKTEKEKKSEEDNMEVGQRKKEEENDKEEEKGEYQEEQENIRKPEEYKGKEEEVASEEQKEVKGSDIDHSNLTLTLPSLKSLSQIEEEQDKHTLALAAATMVAADAATAAAKAAAEVIRLTTERRPILSFYPSTTESIEELSAVQIQTVFRRYLAKRELRALKGVARFEALFQGQAVQRQVTTTMRLMQALSRFQAQFLGRRGQLIFEKGQMVQHKPRQRQQHGHNGKSRFGTSEGWNFSPKTAEEFEAEILRRQQGALKRERALEYDYYHKHRRLPPRYPSPVVRMENGTEHPSVFDSDFEPGTLKLGWTWIDRWMDISQSESMSIQSADQHATMITNRLHNMSEKVTSSKQPTNSTSPDLKGFQTHHHGPSPLRKPMVPKSRSDDLILMADMGISFAPWLRSNSLTYDRRSSIGGSSSVPDDNSPASHPSVVMSIAGRTSPRAHEKTPVFPERTPYPISNLHIANTDTPKRTTPAKEMPERLYVHTIGQPHKDR